MLGIDTNILLRILLADAPGERDAPQQLSLVLQTIENRSEIFFINHIVLAETIWVLRQKMKYGKEIIADTIHRLLRMSNVAVQDEAIVSAALSTFVRYPGDFFDHLIGHINKQNGCRTTLTFDKAALKSPNFSELQR